MRTTPPARAAALAALSCLALVTAADASAQIAPGSRLEFSATVDATDIGADGIVLDFNPSALTFGAGNTGSFAGLNAPGAQGTIADFTVGAGPVVLPSFVQAGGYTFTLLGIPQGTYGQDQCYVEPAIGQKCTPLQLPKESPSPFMVENWASGNPEAPINSVVRFHLYGTVSGPGGVSSDFFGTITANIPGVSFQEALYAVETTGIQGLPISGTFVAVQTTTAPEPGTWALLATGLAGVALVARRRAVGRAAAPAAEGVDRAAS